ncbi:MAG: hypothetical protein SF002_17530 [Alphaproteobacteria bacterium]|nr:hypothetical protein [Alphaproteobacteria bacterium]
MPNLAAIKAAIERLAKSIFAPVRIVDVDVREDMFEPEYIHVTVVYDDGPNGENKDANVDHMIAVSGNAREILARALRVQDIRNDLATADKVIRDFSPQPLDDQRDFIIHLLFKARS